MPGLIPIVLGCLELLVLAGLVVMSYQYLYQTVDHTKDSQVLEID
jgi:hypothetical protein